MLGKAQTNDDGQRHARTVGPIEVLVIQEDGNAMLHSAEEADVLREPFWEDLLNATIGFAFSSPPAILKL